MILVPSKKVQEYVPSEESIDMEIQEKILKLGKEEIPYHIVRSNRKSMAVEITHNGLLLFRLPLKMPESQALEFAVRKQDWIRKHMEESRIRLESPEKQNLESRRDEVYRWWKSGGDRKFAARVKEWADKMNVTYSSITIRDQKTRWGSCSSRGSLNFNWKLLAMPENLMDYVIVHELAHRIEMNHSNRFWAIVEEWIPDYKECRKKLKDYV